MGLDLTCSPRSPSAYAVLDSGCGLVASGVLGNNEAILSTVSSLRPALVAIDSPLALPLGLCCLEESCSCSPLASAPGRVAERELTRRGIGCFFTTKRSIIRPMVYRGIALRQGLEETGIAVIEVYPYASKVRLFGKPLPKKSTRAGVEFLRQRLLPMVHSLESPPLPLGHDLLDAIVAAYTGYLHTQGRTEAVGTVEEQCIVLPMTAIPADSRLPPSQRAIP